MGLFDLAAPLLSAVDQGLAAFLPQGIRLVLWGILAGWLTMLLYRKLSRQEAIAALKAEQKGLQARISAYDGEFSELTPLIKRAFSLGFKQLGLSIGPAILATIPILFIVAWVATTFVYETPGPGEEITVTSEPSPEGLAWSANANARPTETGWVIQWPAPGEAIELTESGEPQLALSDEEHHAVIHKKQWWNVLFGNPAGYLPDSSASDMVRIELPEHEYLPFGPAWMRGWLFAFFGVFLLASIAFKFILKID